eukprot:NODE_804_length_3799_cov_0.577297.p4 type:complete len:230 gc:universal NODE_804_length_3799_cov_0.577297:3708-3019(-)
MIFFSLLTFSKQIKDKNIDAPPNKPPPSDLYVSDKWCPENSKLCVFTAASNNLKIFDMKLEFTLLPNQYVAIGWGGQKMQGADMLVISKIANKKNETKVLVEDYYSKGYQLPKKDKKQDFSLMMNAERSAGRHVVVVRRKINTGDSEDKVFPWNGQFEMIWARGKVGKTISKHTSENVGSMMMNMAKFTNDTQTNNTTETEQKNDEEQKDDSSASTLSILLIICAISLL